MKKPDQARAVYNCSHLFWTNTPTRPSRDGKRVLECLQKALKIADSCMDAAMNVHLFVEILNQYLYYYGKNEAVKMEFLSGLVDLINTHLANLEQPNSAENIAIKTHFQNTLKHINKRKETDTTLNALTAS